VDPTDRSETRCGGRTGACERSNPDLKVVATMRLLLATDGKKAAAGAARMAALLHDEVNAEVKVVHVMEAQPVGGPGSMGVVSFETSGIPDARHDALRERIADIITRTVPNASGWSFEVVAGPAPIGITREADAFEASVIVIGSGRHHRIDRWFGTETALRVSQLSNTPVLVVPEEGGRRLPESLLAATDFSDYAGEAIRGAVRLADPGVVHLAHVITPPPPHEDAFGWDPNWSDEYRERLPARMREWANSIPELSDRTVEFHVLEGDPARELVSLADRLDVDLIAAGSHGLGFFGRLLLGSVSAGILRGADRAVIVSPPSEPAPG